jgi:hypothetical protein
MKYAKMLGIVAVTAMALMVAVAGSASATTLYSGAAKLPKGTKVFTSLVRGSTASLTAPNNELLDTCTAGTVTDETEQESAEEITSGAAITWGETGTTCTKPTTTLKSGKMGMSWSGGQNGAVKSYGAEVTLAGIFATSCVYGTSAIGTTIGTLKGSTTSNATLEVHTILEFKNGGVLCPASAELKATYTVTSPSPLHVTE